MDPKVLHDARAEVDMNVRLARQEMDRKVRLKRESMDEKVKLERQRIERKLKVHRANMDKMIQVERENLDRMLKEQRKSMDRMLKEEREEMDRVIGMERMNMDAEIMQARMGMDRKLHQQREELDLKALQEQKPTTEQLQKEIIPPTQAHQQCIITSDLHLVMEFRIHVVGGEYLYNPKEYHSERIRYMRFLGPAKVEWGPMVENLKCYGHSWGSEVYYLNPMREARDGLVLMEGPKQVDELLQVHLGRKICDLYLVNIDSPSDSDDDEQEEDIEDALTNIESVKEFIARMDGISSKTRVDVTSVTASNKFKRDRFMSPQRDRYGLQRRPKRKNAVSDMNRR